MQQLLASVANKHLLLHLENVIHYNPVTHFTFIKNVKLR